MPLFWHQPAECAPSICLSASRFSARDYHLLADVFCVVALYAVGSIRTTLWVYHKDKNPAESRKPLQEGDAPHGCI